MNNMKSTFLFLLTTTMMTCTAYGQSSNHKENKLPDWAFGGFERPKNVNPVISPIENTKFYCPLTKDSIAWESNDTFNPAATLYNGEIVVLYRAEDKSGVGIGHRTSRLGYATSTDGTHFQREKTPVFYPDNDSQKELEWPGGCEDPRIAVTDDGLYVMMYTQWNRHVPRLAVATSRNLKDWTKHGPAFAKAFDGKFFNLGVSVSSITTPLTVISCQYIGYIDERTFQWLEKDLSYVPKDKLVFVVMHIPSSLQKKLRYNTLDQDETVNTAALYKLLEGYNAHIISGHTHFNVNVCFNDSLMEHNTAAVCGTWWRADINVDGTPRGYGVYEVDGNQVKWIYKSAGYPKEHQLHVYPAGSSDEHPSDIIANVWNWDEQWKVEWYENGKRMGEMQRYKGYDPAAKAICSDKEKVKYEWISPVLTEHLFHATPRNKNAKMEVKVTDRFGNVYTKVIENK